MTDVTREALTQLSEDEINQRLHDSIIRVIRVAISRLYHLSVEDLKRENPTLQEIGNLCELFNKIVEGTSIDGHFTEAIGVINEAADAVHREDAQCLIDCAYHLEDFLSRIT